MMQDYDFKLLRGFGYRRTDRIMGICECCVAFVTENHRKEDDKHTIMKNYGQKYKLYFYQYIQMCM